MIDKDSIKYQFLINFLAMSINGSFMKMKN